MKSEPFKEAQKSHCFVLSLMTVRADLKIRFAFGGQWRPLLLVLLSLTLLNKNWNVYRRPPGLALFRAGMQIRLLLLVHFIIASTNLDCVERIMHYLTLQAGKKIGTELICSLYLLRESGGGYRFIAK